LRVLRGRKGKVKEGKGRKGREGRKEENYSPCLEVEKPTRKRIERVYVIILLFCHFFS
jgi:hypothetical protein